MENHFVYIIYSESIDKFYVGNTDLRPTKRLEQHNTHQSNKSFTFRGRPWNLFFYFNCQSRLQARRIELHIKKMKSRKYYSNLKDYPEMVIKLKKKYNV